jgi:hypothetical protein
MSTAPDRAQAICRRILWPIDMGLGRYSVALWIYQTPAFLPLDSLIVEQLGRPVCAVETGDSGDGPSGSSGLVVPRVSSQAPAVKRAAFRC